MLQQLTHLTNPAELSSPNLYQPATVTLLRRQRPFRGQDDPSPDPSAHDHQEDRNVASGSPGLGPQPQSTWADSGDVRAQLALTLRNTSPAPQVLGRCPTAFPGTLAPAPSVLTLQKCYKALPRYCQGRSCQKLFQKATATCTARARPHPTAHLLNEAVSQSIHRSGRDTPSDSSRPGQSSPRGADGLPSFCCFYSTPETSERAPSPMDRALR